MAEKKTTTTTTKTKVEKTGAAKKTTTKKTTVTKKQDKPVKKVETVEVKEVVNEQPEIVQAEVKPEVKAEEVQVKAETKVQEKSVEDADFNSTKKYAWLAYILFFIPLCINRASYNVRFHANEGLKLNIIDLVAIVFLLIGSLAKSSNLVLEGFLIVLAILSVGVLVLTTITKIYMIYSSVTAKNKEIPWIWKSKYIKY